MQSVTPNSPSATDRTGGDSVNLTESQAIAEFQESVTALFSASTVEGDAASSAINRVREILIYIYGYSLEQIRGLVDGAR